MILVEELPHDRLAAWLESPPARSVGALEHRLLVHRHERDPAYRVLLATAGEAAAGIGEYGRMIDDPVSPIGRAWIGVLPEQRGQGVGSALHRALSGLGRLHGDEELEGDVASPSPETRDFLARRGYRAVQTSVESRLDLRDAPPVDAEPTAGVADIASIADDPSLLEHAYRIALDSEPDIPDVRPWVEPVVVRGVAGARDRRRAVRPRGVARRLVDGEPAAYGLVQLDREGVGEHLATGVARAYRGRGLASSLKRAQIQAARCAGLHGSSRTTTKRTRRSGA